MIRASYDEMHSAAGEISNAGKEYIADVNSLYQVVDNLVQNWKGSDNLKYASTVNSYKELLKSLGEVVISYAQFLDMAARKIQATQDDVASAAGRL